MLNDKKYIFNTVPSEFRATLFFQGKRKLLKNSECESILKTVKFFSRKTVLPGKRKLLKNPDW